VVRDSTNKHRSHHSLQLDSTQLQDTSYNRHLKEYSHLHKNKMISASLYQYWCKHFSQCTRLDESTH